MCNQECFDKWRSEVMMPTPRGQPGRGCSAALQHGDMMHGALCRNVLGDSERGLGLLHSAPGGRGGEVARLVAECGEEVGVGARWRAVDSLVTLLDSAADTEAEESTLGEGEVTTEEEGGDDDEGGEEDVDNGDNEGEEEEDDSEDDDDNDDDNDDDSEDDDNDDDDDGAGDHAAGRG